MTKQFYFEALKSVLGRSISHYFYLLKVNYRNTGTRCDMCWKLTMKTSEWRQFPILEKSVNWSAL